MNAPQVLELPLDDSLLKVLSSESRREILRLLSERRMTGAEMAVRLNLGKPAVSEHLKKLTESGLIERMDDPERRWVYYNLSARGKSILEPQRVRFYLVMAVASLALVLGMALALGVAVFLQANGGAAGAMSANDGTAIDASQAGAGDQTPVTAPQLTVPTTPPVTDSASTPVRTPPPAVGPADAAPVFTTVAASTLPQRPCPLNQDCSGNTTDAFAYVLVLPNGGIAPPLDVSSMYVYHDSDVDPIHHKITVQLVEAAAAPALVANLGAAPDTTFDTLANSTLAVHLQTGGSLLSVPANVEVPSSTPSDATAAPPATDASVTQPSSAEPSTPLPSDTQPAASAPAQSAEPASPPAGTNPPQAAPVQPAATPPQVGPVAPPASSATVTPGAATDTAAPAVSPVVSGQASAPANGGTNPAPTGLSQASRDAAVAREPGDSALLPFVALIGAAVLVGVVRRRA
ncbi:MAG: ArsR family transcriptional regulator [bacterium]